MGSWRKVGAFLGLVPEDRAPDGEYADDDYDAHPDGEYQRGDYQRGDYQRGEYEQGDYRAEPGEFEPGGYESPYRQAPRQYEPQPVHGSLALADRRDPDTGAVVRPVTVKLAGFGEARIIGEKFREGQPVILDMTEMDDAGARRLVDFAAGLAFALRGSIDKVTTKVFMLLPADADAAEVGHLATTGASGGSSPYTPPHLADRRAYAGR